MDVLVNYNIVLMIHLWFIIVILKNSSHVYNITIILYYMEENLWSNGCLISDLAWRHKSTIVFLHNGKDECNNYYIILLIIWTQGEYVLMKHPNMHSFLWFVQDAFTVEDHFFIDYKIFLYIIVLIIYSFLFLIDVEDKHPWKLVCYSTF